MVGPDFVKILGILLVIVELLPRGAYHLSQRGGCIGYWAEWKTTVLAKLTLFFKDEKFSHESLSAVRQKNRVRLADKPM